MLIELHLLQSFPVSNLNRDDLGQPKTARFGGFTRARVSSQSLKRAARRLFTQNGLQDSDMGIRTKRLRDGAAELLKDRGRNADQSVELCQAALAELGFKPNTSTGLTEYLLFVGSAAQQELADYCEQRWDDLTKAVEEAKKKKEEAKKKNQKEKETASSRKAGPAKAAKVKPSKERLEAARRILDGSRAADIGLFGRMVADNTDFNVNGASQVAHALSTHAVVNEFDYYTALDDLRPDAEPAADMIGTVDFNAACFYRYANLDLGQLEKNLEGDAELAARAARAWLLSFIHAVPSGKQNSMAARTVPHTLLGVVREDGAWNLANAFLKPVSDVPDLMAASTEFLVRHFQQTRSFYGDAQIRHTTFAALDGDTRGFSDSEVAADLDDFVVRLLTATKG
ncbi:type I-E CRISPR-associated protein Cas7/Cse4/CasC [Streptomyces hygroscopicus]|uniref:type I-E CRISPR-associated protein Cas7/Cse4/CasC n=1 Tax=Streptomyces hygroscopicus TaxID=1912 RepID=UPI0004CB218C|nr:type I-E CRISPR-associated protein Cas7/Cse4/CasC [Streptomyces hygroscopicus]